MRRLVGLFVAALVAASLLAISATPGAAATKPVLVKDIKPGAASAEPFDLTKVNGALFFTADDATHGSELWRSDGTVRGTTVVKDINPGPSSSAPRGLTNVNGTLFFAADDGIHGHELWKSDGTAVGTTPLKEFGSGFRSGLGNLTNVNGTLFFVANEFNADDPDFPGAGEELWKSDGTAAGTTLVKDINPGPGGSFPQFLTNVDGTLFFNANDPAHGYELWKSDGTAAGTTLVKDINPGPDDTRLQISGSSFPQELTNVNGTLFFGAYDGTRGGIWKSDGTATGTTLIDFGRYGGSGLTDFNGTLFFDGSADMSGIELWKSDGTAAGTTLVKDIWPGAGSSQPRFLSNVEDTMFFNARDGTDGLELWKSDGTAAGTALVKDINPGAASSFPSDERAYEDLQNPLTNVNGTLFFDADDGIHGLELWRSDGTARGTTLVGDINPGAGSSFPGGVGFYGELVNLNGTLIFSADDGPHGFELWKTKPRLREAKPKPHG